MEILALCDLVRETGYAIHRFHRHGHLEKIYENALAHRLRKARIEVVQQHPLPVFDEDGALLGDYFADLFVASCLIVEVKAVSHVLNEHTAQLLGYLRSSKWNTASYSTSGHQSSPSANSSSTTPRKTTERSSSNPFVFLVPFRGHSLPIPTH